MQNAVILQLINQRVFDFCKKHMNWNQKHYENTYCDVFEGVAGVILRHEGLI